MGYPIDCPNLRYKKTSSGGILGIGSKGYWYCSCNSQQLDPKYVNNVCSGRRNYRPGDNMQYVSDYQVNHRKGENATSAFLDCNQYQRYGIKN